MNRFHPLLALCGQRMFFSRKAAVRTSNSGSDNQVCLVQVFPSCGLSCLSFSDGGGVLPGQRVPAERAWLWSAPGLSGRHTPYRYHQSPDNSWYWQLL